MVGTLLLQANSCKNTTYSPEAAETINIKYKGKAENPYEKQSNPSNQTTIQPWPQILELYIHNSLDGKVNMSQKGNEIGDRNVWAKEGITYRWKGRRRRRSWKEEALRFLEGGRWEQRKGVSSLKTKVAAQNFKAKTGPRMSRRVNPCVGLCGPTKICWKLSFLFLFNFFLKLLSNWLYLLFSFFYQTN